MTSTRLTLTAQTEFASVAHDSSIQSFLALVSIVAPPAPQTSDATQPRTAMDLVAVLDRSGSMAGEKIKMLHRTVELLIQHLKENDRLSLVAYDDRVETPLPLTRMTEEGKTSARMALQSITDRGCTNLSGGLMEGLEVLGRRDTKNEVSSVLLMTDGLANAGVTDKTQIVEMTKAKLTQLRNPVSVYTFGFGSDHDASLLAQISDAGAGSYYYMNTPDSIPQAFADCVGGLMSVAAQNINISFTAAAGVTIHDVITNFAKTVETPNQKVSVRIGDIFAEERKDLLVELSLPVAPSGQTTDQQVLLGVEMSYFDISSVSTEHINTVVSVARTPSASENGSSSLEVDQHRNRIRTARAMEQAMQLGDRGDVAQARTLLQQCYTEVSKSASAQVADCQAYMGDLLSVSNNMQSRQQYTEVAQKKLNVKSRKHWAQREMECDDNEGTTYATTAKAQLRSAWK